MAPADPNPITSGLRGDSPVAEISARLERLPFTRVQRVFFLVVATAWLFDSIDLAMITFVLAPISTEFALTPGEAGLVGSASFAGMLVGAIGAGALADRIGRRRVFQNSIIIWGVASLGLVFVSDLPSLLGLRFLLGVGMGAEFPVAAALLAEFMPAERRGRYVALLEGAWPVGFVIAGVLALVVVPLAGWRSVFAIQAGLALWALAIRRLVPESPRWLASRGRVIEADQILCLVEKKVQRELGRELPPIPVVAQPLGRATEARGLNGLLSAGYRSRTVMIWTVWFCILLGYYGVTTWMGKLLTDSGFAVATSIGFLVLMTLWGVPGFISAALLIEKVGRRACIVSYTLLSAAAAFWYGNADSTAELITSGSVMQFCFFGMWSSLYAYTPELFPTRFRATGVGTATAAGRLGALIGPIMVPVLIVNFGNAIVFAASAVLFAVAALLVMLFGPETRKRILEDVAA
jgi:putative MFS transporter